MRSSVRPSLNSNSQIGGFPSMSAIKTNSVFSKDSKFNQVEEVGMFYQKLFGNVPLTEKDLADAKRIGYGYKKFQNSDAYYGQLDNDRPHGQGVYVYWSTAEDRKPYFYKGNFVNGEFSGFGKLCKILNEREAIYCYQGFWKNGKRQGEGKQNYNTENTMFYKGGFLNDQRHGQGLLIMPDGNYDGMWQEGKMNGEGVLTIEKGPFKDAISGQWIQDQIALGTIQYYSKSSSQLLGQYKGEIKNLVRSGQGVYRTGNYLIQGVFQDDEVVGTCVLQNSTPPYQYTLKGELNQIKLDKIDADIKYQNNDRYQGLVEITPNHIIRRTKGKYYFANGEIIEGTFEDNQRGEIVKKN